MQNITIISETNSRRELIVGNVTTKSQASFVASQWHDTSLGTHAEVFPRLGGYVCRVVNNFNPSKAI